MLLFLSSPPPFFSVRCLPSAVRCVLLYVHSVKLRTNLRQLLSIYDGFQYTNAYEKRRPNSQVLSDNPFTRQLGLSPRPACYPAHTPYFERRAQARREVAVGARPRPPSPYPSQHGERRLRRAIRPESG